MDMNGMNGTVDAAAREDEEREVEITPKRLDELARWHGTDENALPPEHTLQHLARDTVAALRALAQDRATIARLRAAMSRAFWAEERRELNAILLEALGPPPAASSAEAAGREPANGEPQALHASSAQPQRGASARLDAEIGRGLHHSGAARPLSPRAS
jgi:hypothetical protein